MRKKWFIVILVFIFLGVGIYIGYQNYKLGSREDREELLTEVVFDLVEKRSMTKEDVKEIQIFRMDAGVYPFFYNVLVTLKDGKELSYTWGNKEKSKLNVSVYESVDE